MKDTEALRRQLEELADETPEVSPQEWLAGTRHKVRVRRRVRVIGAIGALVLALGVGTAVVPRMLDDSAPRPVEPVPTPDGQVGWAFPGVTETDRVIASRVNDPDTSEIVWRAKIKTPADTFFMTFCRLPHRPEPGQPRVRVMATINGRPTTTEGDGCSYREKYPPLYGTLVSQNLTPGFDKYYDVEPNEEFPVAVWLERNGERVEVPGVSFGFALVACAGRPERDADGDGFLDGSMGRPGCQALTFPGPGAAAISPPFPWGSKNR
jgi:hypothetical protein